MLRSKQLRVVYSLMKPAVRMAARFEVPVRSLSELLRLAYYEVLVREGLSQKQIADRFGQTTRHVRSLAKRFAGDFFEAEKDVGLIREVESSVAREPGDEATVIARMPAFEPDGIRRALRRLEEQHRIERDGAGSYRIGGTFVVMASEHFHQRIDALNHHLDGLFDAVVARLLRDDRETAMIKTISFSASPAALRAYLDRLEGDLRRDLAGLEERAAYEGDETRRFTLGLHLSAESE